MQPWIVVRKYPNKKKHWESDTYSMDAPIWPLLLHNNSKPLVSQFAIGATLVRTCVCNAIFPKTTDLYHEKFFSFTSLRNYPPKQLTLCPSFQRFIKYPCAILDTLDTTHLLLKKRNFIFLLDTHFWRAVSCINPLTCQSLHAWPSAFGAPSFVKKW